MRTPIGSTRSCGASTPASASADWLAIHYQKRTLLALRITHVLAFFMGSMFILYSDLDTLDYFLYGLLGFVLLALACWSRPTGARGTASTSTTARWPKASACSSSGPRPASRAAT